MDGVVHARRRAFRDDASDLYAPDRALLRPEAVERLMVSAAEQRHEVAACDHVRRLRYRNAGDGPRDGTVDRVRHVRRRRRVRGDPVHVAPEEQVAEGELPLHVKAPAL